MEKCIVNTSPIKCKSLFLGVDNIIANRNLHYYTYAFRDILC